MDADELSGNDPLLARLLAAVAAEDHEEATADLIASHAVPTIDAVLRARLGRGPSPRRELLEDLRGDVIVRLLHRLQRLADDPEAAPIRSFADYVAVATYHRCDDFVRSTFPARSALANRVRYLFSRVPGLALWPSRTNSMLGGLAEWRQRELEPTAVPEGLDLGVPDLRRLALEDLITRLFLRLSRPVELSELIAWLADRLQLSEPSPVPWPVEPPNGPGNGPLEQLETLQYLRRLWQEIRELPPRQRLALLLSIRDNGGESVAWLLPFTGIANRAEIAATLGLDGGELATLWEQMPVDDNRIAGLLGATRQQVINLRKAARERLARRMAAVDQEARFLGRDAAAGTCENAAAPSGPMPCAPKPRRSEAPPR